MEHTTKSHHILHLSFITGISPAPVDPHPAPGTSEPSTGLCVKEYFGGLWAMGGAMGKGCTLMGMGVLCGVQ